MLEKEGISKNEKEKLMEKIHLGNYLTPQLTLSGFHTTVRFNGVDNLISNVDFCSSLNEVIDSTK